MTSRASWIMFICLGLCIFAAPFLVLQAHFFIFSAENSVRDQGVYGRQAMVVSAHGLASDVGREILARGGNAFDAAIAVNFALAVVYPQAGNIGGGGFMVFRQDTGQVGALDFREKAPLAATTDMYLDDAGQVRGRDSLLGHRAVGVPGTVAGMAAIHARFGSLPWPELIEPAISLAHHGYVLSEKAARMLNRYRGEFRIVNPEGHAYWENELWHHGDLLRLPNLAQTLRRIMIYGPADFYIGETARLIIAEMARGDGLITAEDLRQYDVRWRIPIQFSYRGFEVITMPPPSSGGVALQQLLTAAEAYDLNVLGHNSDAYMHVLTELERRVYADRAAYLGDPDFVEVPVQYLTSRTYLDTRMADIEMDQKTDSQRVGPGLANAIESVETTHFSIVDPQGNAVAITTTLNGNFGSKLVVEGAGFFLNNEMDDFSIKAGRANQFGLLGGHANAIAPSKRMLSSMTPTIVTHDDALYLVLGTPGGATIITSVFQALLNMIDFGMSAQEAVNARKFHSQWQPDIVLLEKGAPDLFDLAGLKMRGHQLHYWPDFSYELGRLEVIRVMEDGRLEGAADWTRGHDDRAAGF